MRAFKDTFHSTGSSRGHGSIRHFSSGQHKQGRQGRSAAKIPPYIFAKNVSPPTPDFKLPEADERLVDTPQLVHCLGLLQDSRSIDDIIEPAARKWLQAVVKDTDEQERLKTMSTEVIRAFKRDEIKDAGVVNEVVCLAPVLNKDVFADLLSEFYKGIDHSGLLRAHQLEGLAQLIQGADPGHLNADDLVKILELLSNRLRDTYQQSSNNMHQPTLAVSHVLDAMTDTNVTGLDRERLHEPLSIYLKELKESEDSYLIYQAAYAYQALLCVPDNESVWQAGLRRTGRVVFGFSGIASAVKDQDLSKFVESLESIQKSAAGAADIVHTIASAYGDIKSLTDSGQSLLECLKESFSTKGKRAWYSALRGADTLIRDGELALFKKLVCEAPSCLDAAFQWGVCLRLGRIAAGPMWERESRRSAVAFLGEIYQNDEVWGQQSSVKQWILNILMHLASATGINLQCMQIVERMAADEHAIVLVQ